MYYFRLLWNADFIFSFQIIMSGFSILFSLQTIYQKVAGKRVIVKLNDKTIVDFTEPENVQRSSIPAIPSGIFALRRYYLP